MGLIFSVASLLPASIIAFGFYCLDVFNPPIQTISSCVNMKNTCNANFFLFAKGISHKIEIFHFFSSKEGPFVFFKMDNGNLLLFLVFF